MEKPRHGPERLRVYHLALAFCEDIDALIETARCSPSLRDQAQRAAESVLLNIAEGAGHFSSGKKIYHYQLALGSASECLAILTRLRQRNRTLGIFRAKNNIETVSAMLHGLIASHSTDRRAGASGTQAEAGRQGEVRPPESVST